MVNKIKRKDRDADGNAIVPRGRPAKSQRTRQMSAPNKKRFTFGPFKYVPPEPTDREKNYADGVKAGSNFEAHSSNPHDVRSDDHRDWHEGWQKGNKMVNGGHRSAPQTTPQTKKKQGLISKLFKKSKDK